MRFIFPSSAKKSESGGDAGNRQFGIPRQVKPPFDLEAILGVDINTPEKKPWLLPSAVLSDFFNYGHDVESWKTYHSEALSKILSGR